MLIFFTTLPEEIIVITNINFCEHSEFYTPNIGIEIVTDEDLSPNVRNLIDKANFSSTTPIESWSVLGTNQQQAYLTHGIFRYFGKFPPSIATYLITTFSTTDELVIDPMCGSGSTALECKLLNRSCVINDINPLSIAITKAKTTYIAEDRLTRALNKIVKNYKPLTVDEYPFTPSDLENYQHWFLEETENSLRGLKFLIEKISDKDIRNFYLVIFASIVRRVSKATTQQGRLFLDINTAVPDALEMFKNKALKEIKNVSRLPENTAKVQIYNSDMKNLQMYNYKGKASLVILHPPYFNSYKYSSINSLESGWLGFSRVSFRKQEIKEFFKVGKPEKYIDYVNDMEIALNSALELLKPGGTLALMIGDSIIKGNYLPVTNTLINRIDISKYAIEKIAVRVPKYTEASWVASQRRNSNDIGVSLNDFIVIIRRKENE